MQSVAVVEPRVGLLMKRADRIEPAFSKLSWGGLTLTALRLYAGKLLAHPSAVVQVRSDRFGADSTDVMDEKKFTDTSLSQPVATPDTGGSLLLA